MAENVQAPAPVAAPPNFRAMLPDLVIDGALPAIAYQVLSRYGVAAVSALTAGAIFPAANIMRKFAATRRIDLIGAIVLVFIAIGVAGSLLSGSVLFILIKESFITGMVGLLFLSSFLWRRPIFFYLGRQFAAGEDPERLVWWNGLWEHARFRRIMRIMTTVSGVSYVVEAAVRVLFALTLTPGTVVVLSPIMGIGTTVILIIWTRRYGRAAQERAAREAALAGSALQTGATR
jgi:hypothetical protein